MGNLAHSTISDISRLIQARQVSPLDLAKSSLSLIETLDGELRSFVTVRAEEALEDARQAEVEIAAGRYRGPMHGIPIAIKDNIAVAGLPTTNGSQLMANNVTDYDATVVSRLKQAGAVVLGKNNMHEWAMGGTSSRMYYGTVRNPWDTSRIPGGSSGGSAAAVSAGLAMASVGTDGMGSIRAPAAFCGVVGMKPTYGLVSRFGELPATSSWIDHIGPIGRSVPDVALMLSIVEGVDPADPTSRAAAALPAKDHAGWRGLRVGVISNYFPDDLVPEIAMAFDKVIGAMEAAGVELYTLSAPTLEHAPLTLLGIHAERESFLREYAVRGEGFASEEIRMRVLAAQLVPAADLRRALRVRWAIRHELWRLLSEVDVIACPTTPTPAFQIDAKGVALGPRADEVNVTSPGVANRVTVRTTYPFNIAGCPAISVPAGFVNGLPWGMHFAAAPWRDSYLLKVATAFEEDFAPGYQVPSIARCS